MLQSQSRRPPPTPLRLYQGPLPLRNRPKHTLPSVPRPTYVPLVPAINGPKPRARVQEPVPVSDDPISLLSYEHLPRLIIPSGPSHSRRSSWSSDGSVSPVSSASSGGLSRRSSVESLDGGESAMPVRQRGPWDHSASIKIPFDVSSVLVPPRPAAVNNVSGLR